MLLTVTADAEVEDHGTVVLITGFNDEGLHQRFGADHRIAQDVLDAAVVEGEITVEVEDWQLWGGAFK